ncbi:peritrophin-44 [Musca domestica]|uniref:Peritrophin-44 n=1 Tax=Musca domestica TaxID=7370 RepID=A0A1I8MSY8_MUSDO|nr:peritrophin-44 [Musca domestica]
MALKSIPFIALLYLMLSTVGPSYGQPETTFDPDTLCPLVAHGTKIKDPRYCNIYVECLENDIVTRSCEDLYFDIQLGQCVDPLTTTCLSSQPCIGKNGVFVADPYNCESYYYCSNGVGIQGQCSAGMSFNPETGFCVRDFPCHITMYPEDYCNLFAEGVFVKVPDSCRHYQTCWRSELINGSCPGILFFDAPRGGCDDPLKVDCDEPMPEIPEHVVCRENNEFISDGISCDGYFFCQQNLDGEFRMFPGSCPKGRFFDKGECVPRSHTKCDHDRCVGMGYEYMQMVNIDGDGCRGFAVCQRGKEIGRSQCPEGWYFDEWEQFCVDKEIQYESCRDGLGTTPRPMETITNEDMLNNLKIRNSS